MKYKVRLSTFLHNNSVTLDNKRVLLLISVGQQYHEGDKLQATIKKLNQFNISFCQILVADTLQRYNYQTGNPWKDTLRLGDSWIDRNKKYIDLLECQHEIKRWDELLKHSRYREFKDVISDLYKSGIVKEGFDQRIRDYQLRHHSTDTKSCLNYIMEECPIILCISALNGYDNIIYPSPMTTAMMAIYNTEIKDKFKDKCQWIHLRFKKRKMC